MESNSVIQPLTPLAPKDFDSIIDESAAFIRAGGVSNSYIQSYRGAVRHFLIWLARIGCAVGKINAAVIERFLAHDCSCRDEKSRPLRVARWRSPSVHIIRFVRFLEQSGRIETHGVLEDGMRIVHELEERLHHEGYAPGSAALYRNICSNLVVWLHFSRIRLSELTPEVIERFHERQLICSIPGLFKGQGRCPDKWRYDWVIRRFLMHLAECGHIEPLAHGAHKARSEVLDRFSAWLDRHRGNSASTRQQHLRLIAAMLKDLGEDPRGYDAALIRDVLFAHIQRCSHSHAQRLLGSMRMYLRFLISEGAAAASLLGAVPSAPRGRQDSLPRHISQADVERAIACCDDSPIGVRDKAILLLLARLALRAQDIVELRCCDIDWERARIRVSGKSRQTVELPLPQDVGDALHGYLSTVRPKVREDKVFLCARAPWRPLSRSNTVSNLARRALDRAGAVTPARRGAHVFRHSQATNLLRAGASLDTIQALLRHTNADTTAIYAKTDIAMLTEIAQPWLEEVAS